MATSNQTEKIDQDLLDLELRTDENILSLLLDSQQAAITAVEHASTAIARAVNAAQKRLSNDNGRLVLVGAGASGRLAVQDGAEMWPTYGWPHERLLLCIAGGNDALVRSVEGTEDDADAAIDEVKAHAIGEKDVVIAVAASGESPWTCAWLREADRTGALTVGMANNNGTTLLKVARHPVLLDSGREVLAGSTRMAAGTAQKAALNLFSTLLMIRLNRTYGNLMVDMAASNRKLASRRIRMLKQILPGLSTDAATDALTQSRGWIKLAAIIASGVDTHDARQLLQQHSGNLRDALGQLKDQ